MIMFIVFGAAQAFAPDMVAPAVIRFFLGIPLGSDIANGYTYIMEAMPKGKREVMGNRWQFMFAFGEVIAGAVVALMYGLGLGPSVLWRVALGPVRGSCAGAVRAPPQPAGDRGLADPAGQVPRGQEGHHGHVRRAAMPTLPCSRRSSRWSACWRRSSSCARSTDIPMSRRRQCQRPQIVVSDLPEPGHTGTGRPASVQNGPGAAATCCHLRFRAAELAAGVGAGQFGGASRGQVTRLAGLLTATRSLAMILITLYPDYRSMIQRPQMGGCNDANRPYGAGSPGETEARRFRYRGLAA